MFRLKMHFNISISFYYMLLLVSFNRNKDGKFELDFETDQYDILVSDFDIEEKETGGVTSELPETDYSLRVSKSGFLSTKKGKISLI